MTWVDRLIMSGFVLLFVAIVLGVAAGPYLVYSLVRVLVP